MRPPVTKPAPGDLITQSDFCKLFNVDAKTVRDARKAGKIKDTGTPASPKDPVYLVYLSAWQWYQNYKPHKDNAKRRAPKGQTIPEMQTEQAKATPDGSQTVTDIIAKFREREANKKSLSSPPAVGTGTGRVGSTTSSGGARPAAPSGYVIPARTLYKQVPQGVGVRLDNAAWWAVYRRAKLPKLAESTIVAYRTFSNRFLVDMPVLDLTDTIGARRDIMGWLNNLEDTERPGQEVQDGTKVTYLKKVNAYLKWLNREYGYPKPDLTEPDFSKGGHGVPIYAYQTREILKWCRNDTEKDMVIILALTGMRLSDYITMTPELLHSEDGHHYIEVMGKRTKANLNGYRQVPLVEEAYRRLQSHFERYGDLTWINDKEHGKPAAYRIGGIIQPASSRTPVDLREPRQNLQPPKTFKITTYKGAGDRVGNVINRLVKDAGVYQFGMGVDGWRHNLTQPFLANGGDKKHCDWILGHFAVNEVADIYTHIPIMALCAQAERHVDRSFLAAPQGS